MSESPVLRPYQREAIDRFLSQPNRRLLLALPTGAGKTRTAIECARAVGAKRILVVASAMARPVWKAEFKKWAPELEAHTIRFGKERKNLTKAQALERTAAYSASVQVVSYALLRDYGADSPPDLCIIDEVHALRNPLSKQSRLVKALAKAFPKMPIVALSATPVPNEVSGIWNLADTLSPGFLGKATDTGDVSWSFRRTYMEKIESEYGTAYKGSLPGSVGALEKKLAPLFFRVDSATVNTFMPPVRAELLYIDEPRTDLQVAQDWLEDAMEDTTHVAVVPFTHKLHAALEAHAQKLGRPVFAFTGEDSVERRQELLDAARQVPSAIVLATAGCISEAVSLSMCTRALFLEWRATPAQAIQLIGRFPRSDAAPDSKFFMQYVCHAKDETKIAELGEKIAAAAALFGVGSNGELVAGIMKRRVLTESEEDAMLARLFDNFNENALERVTSALGGKDEEDDENT